MALTLVRHTRPAVADGLCYGASDPDCAPGFAEEAAAVIAALPPAARIVTSPLRRCLRLAEAIGAARGRAPEVDPRLAEMDFGAWEKAAWDAIPRGGLDAWAADFHHARPHGGESVAMLSARVAEALAAHRAAGGDAVLVTHMGVIRAALAAAGRADAWSLRLPFGAIVRLSGE